MLNRLFPIYLIIFYTAVASGMDLAKEDDQIAYSLGLVTGENIKYQEKSGIKINLDIFIQGLKDTIANKPQLNQEQMLKALNMMQQKGAEEQKKMLKKTSATNLQTGKDFLANNKKNIDVVELQNGLQYQIINHGDQSSKSPNINDKVQVQYRGSLLDGTQFDSSYESSKPAIFELKSLIKGWQEALMLMKPKSKWKIFVPPQLAYGTEGAGAQIGPNSVLVFDIELVSVNPA